MTRKRLVALLALAGALYATRPRPEELVPYTTPPLNAQGDRVSLLVPRNWERSPQGRYADSVHPKDGHPEWMKRLGIGRIDEAGVVFFQWFSAADAERIGVRPFEPEEVIRGEHIWTARSYLPCPEPGSCVLLMYERGYEGAFDKTHAAIFRSARIVPGGGKR